LLFPKRAVRNSKKHGQMFRGNTKLFDDGGADTASASADGRYRKSVQIQATVCTMSSFGGHVCLLSESLAQGKGAYNRDRGRDMMSTGSVHRSEVWAKMRNIRNVHLSVARSSDRA
jgi:hypothetical protein